MPLAEWSIDALKPPVSIVPKRSRLEVYELETNQPRRILTALQTMFHCFGDFIMPNAPRVFLDTDQEPTLFTTSALLEAPP